MCKKCSHSPHSPDTLAQKTGRMQSTHSPRPLCNRGGRVSVCVPCKASTCDQETRGECCPLELTQHGQRRIRAAIANAVRRGDAKRADALRRLLARGRTYSVLQPNAQGGKPLGLPQVVPTAQGTVGTS